MDQSTDANISHLLQRVSDLESDIQTLRADLRDQSNGREQWMKRGQKAERIQAVHPFILTIIDGNNLWFRDQFNKPDCAAEVAASIVSEMRDHARVNHRYNLPEGIAALVQIFVDLGQLAKDLMAAEAISKNRDLLEFMEALNSQPNVSVVACNYKAVQQRITSSYEPNIENCHCQHIPLALGPSSKYYNTLEEYSSDDYTMLKTSLIRPCDAFPAQYELLYETTSFSSMQNVPLTNFALDSLEDFNL